MKCSWQRRNARQTEKDTSGERTEMEGEKERKKEKGTRPIREREVKGGRVGAYGR